MIAITEDLRQMFSRESDTVENFATHTVTCAVLKCYGHRSAYAFLNISYLYHVTRI
ncbi:hypothetical protein ACK8P8_01595 [Butyricimonas sp. GBGM4]